MDTEQGKAFTYQLQGADDHQRAPPVAAAHALALHARLGSREAPRERRVSVEVQRGGCIPLFIHPNRQGAQRAAAAVPCVNASVLVMTITALQPRLRVTLFSHGADRNGSTTPSFRARGTKKAQRTAHTRTHTEKDRNMFNLHKWASYDLGSHG